MKQRAGNTVAVDWRRTVVPANAQQSGETSGPRLKITEGRRRRQQNGWRVSQLFWRNSARVPPHQHYSGVM